MFCNRRFAITLASPFTPSTSEVYGTARCIPISEDHPLQGQSPYSASKIGADKIAESVHLSFGLPVITVRPFNTYGPRQSARAVIPTIITQTLADEPIRLGNLEPTRDLNYVEDTVEGFIKAAECIKAAGQVINLGSGSEISIKELTALILKLMKKDLPIVSEGERVRPEGSEVERLCADNEKARDAAWLGTEIYARRRLKRALSSGSAKIRRSIEVASTSFEPGALAPSGMIPLSVPLFGGNEWKYLKECLDSGWVSSAGPFVDRFEREVADYVGAGHAVAIVNGTAALHTSLLVAGVKPDDEVLVSTLTFIAPVNTIRYAGAWPVLIDAERPTGRWTRRELRTFSITNAAGATTSFAIDGLGGASRPSCRSIFWGIPATWSQSLPRRANTI
jgi:hypothetical protein